MSPTDALPLKTPSNYVCHCKPKGLVFIPSELALVIITYRSFHEKISSQSVCGGVSLVLGMTHYKYCSKCETVISYTKLAGSELTCLKEMIDMSVSLLHGRERECLGNCHERILHSGPGFIRYE